MDVSHERLRIAELQFDAMNASLKTMLKNCGRKCIPEEYGEADLNKGESTCTDRCVAKFMEANRIIGIYAQSVRFDETDLKHFQTIKEKYLRPEERR